MQIAGDTDLGLRARRAERARWNGVDRARARAAWLVFVRDVFFPFVVTRLLLGIVAIIATAALPLSPWIPASWLRPGLLPVLDAFSRWDGLHYVDIAQSGYGATDPTNVAFFPLYPLLMRGGATLTGSVTVQSLELWGIVISNACLLIAASLLVALCRMEFGHRVASRAAWYLLIFPTSFFLSAIYAESLFLALSIGSVLAARRGHWLLAGLLGGCAALTRPFGFVVAVPLAVEAALQWRSGQRTWRPAAGILAVPTAFAGYLVFLWYQRGDALAFLHVENGWGRSLTLTWETFTRFFAQPITVNTGLHSAVDLGFAVATIALAVAAWKLLRPSYALYLSVLVLIPLSSGSLGSLGRFDVVFFPLILVLARLGRRPALDRAINVVGIGLGGLLMALFAQWYWVA